MSLLGSRNFVSSQDNGKSRALKLADLYIKSNTNDSGKVSDPNVYSYVISNYLAPYADDIGVQQKIASYQNNIKSLGQASFEQDNTLVSFQRNLNDAVYFKGDTLRNPGLMAQATATNLDNLSLGVDAAISQLDAAGKSTDKLIDFKKKIADMSTGARDLVNKFGNGTLPPNLDGYGYYVKTSPIDGSLLGAALLPINSAPSDLTDHTKRISNTLNLGSARIPVFLPVTQNDQGDYVAKLYGNTWSGTQSDATLAPGGTNGMKTNDSFDLTDTTKYPIKQTNLSPGTFGKVLAGVQDGQAQYNYYYRGVDGKVRQLDQNSIDLFKSDPVLGKQLNNYVPLLGMDDVANLGNVVPTSAADVKSLGLQSASQQAQATATQLNQNVKDEQARYGGLEGKIADVGNAIGGAAQKVGGFFKNIFARKNTPTAQQTAPESSGGTPSAPEIINKGNTFFKQPYQP